MLFNSFQFVAFMLVFVPAYWLLYQRIWMRNLLILVASYVFYGVWDERFLMLLAASTASDYAVGLLMSGAGISRRQIATVLAFLSVVAAVAFGPSWAESSWMAWWVVGLVAGGSMVAWTIGQLPERHRRRAYLTAAITLNLGILGFFKYFNFFAGSLSDLAGTVGWTLSPLMLDVILPVGISFYTFQSMSYAIDVYRGDVKAEPDLVKFAAYVSFFPQLVAGPIERAQNLLNQFATVRPINGEHIASGALLFAWGLYKKVVIADNVAPMADQVFADPSAFSTSELLAASIAFTFQIYCDFSGYSDMARGLARALGFDLMLNFRLPYFARTPSEFWQRWHISLSSWLRDYLYVPLGGNRKNNWNTYRNLSLTMILGGLWHGANWTFVLWGAYHGLLLVVYRMAGVDRWLTRPAPTAAARVIRDIGLMALMFTFTVGGWLLFRISSVEALVTYLHGIASWTWSDDSGMWSKIAILVLPLLVVQVLQHQRDRLEIFTELHPFARLNLGIVAVCGLLFGASGSVPFIYFDF